MLKVYDLYSSYSCSLMPIEFSFLRTSIICREHLGCCVFMYLMTKVEINAEKNWTCTPQVCLD